MLLGDGTGAASRMNSLMLSSESTAAQNRTPWRKKIDSTGAWLRQVATASRIFALAAVKNSHLTHLRPMVHVFIECY